VHSGGGGGGGYLQIRYIYLSPFSMAVGTGNTFEEIRELAKSEAAQAGIQCIHRQTQLSCVS